MRSASAQSRGWLTLYRRCGERLYSLTSRRRCILVVKQWEMESKPKERKTEKIIGLTTNQLSDADSDGRCSSTFTWITRYSRPAADASREVVECLLLDGLR